MNDASSTSSFVAVSLLSLVLANPRDARRLLLGGTEASSPTGATRVEGALARRGSAGGNF